MGYKYETPAALATGAPIHKRERLGPHFSPGSPNVTLCEPGHMARRARLGRIYPLLGLMQPNRQLCP